MKLIKHLISTLLMTSLLIGSIAYAQLPPIGNAGTAKHWTRSGNNLGGVNPPDANIFGTMWNSPIYTYTDAVPRGIWNGTRTPNINGFIGVDTSGFVGIGPNNVGTSHPLGFWQDVGPFSLLHLNGVTEPGDRVFPGGYRPWMRTGITFSDQTDLAYIGLRSVFPTNNINEFVINWSNDPNVGVFGPDDMVFRFSAGNALTAGGISNNLSVNNDLDGLHVARFTGTGEFGLGNTFGAGPPLGLYARPVSLLHMSKDRNKATWLQITNQNGTGQTALDGLRLGFRNTNASGAGYLRWQENTPFIIQTDWKITPGGINSGERMRITDVGSLVGTPNYLGLMFPANRTRIAISHQGSNPITRPMSLLHLGLNTGDNQGISTDGWRPWMDIGTFISNGADNMYVGLKDEDTGDTDAVINWGGNSAPGGGPDHLRFIYTGNGPDINGLEVARMVPTKATTLDPPNFGMMGVGDFSLGSPNDLSGMPIDAKLDIDGDLRIREVDNKNNLAMVLVIDPDDKNRVNWRDAATLTGASGGLVMAQNGLNTIASGTGAVELGGDLIRNTTVSQNAHNLFFEGADPLDRFSIGDPSFTSYKFSVKNFDPTAGIMSLRNSINTRVLTVDDDGSLIGQTETNQRVGYNFNPTFTTPQSTFTRGVEVDAIGDFDMVGFYSDPHSTLSASATNFHHTGFLSNIGPQRSSATTKIGFASNILSSTSNIYNLAGSATDIGFLGFVSASDTVNDVYGVRVRSQIGSTGTGKNYGGHFFASTTSGAQLNYGVYAQAAGGPANASFAGWFQGDVNVTGTLTVAGINVPSDSQFKQNQQPLVDATSIISQLQPKTYNLDSDNFTQFDFDTKQNMGLIAQEVEQVLPNLVSNKIMPAQFDTTGVQTSAEINYKALDYQQLIPLLIAGMQELQNDLSAKKLLITNLETRLAALEQ